MRLEERPVVVSTSDNDETPAVRCFYKHTNHVDRIGYAYSMGK